MRLVSHGCEACGVYSPQSLMPHSRGLAYRVNRLDEIVSVSQGWDAFAMANDGHAACADRVLRRPLLHFIADHTTRHLYEQVLIRARAGRKAVFTFRCDSADERRLLEMRVSPLEHGDVLFVTETLSIEHRAHVATLDLAAPRSGDLIRVCGWCKKVHDGDCWTEIEEALHRLKLLECIPVPRLTHGICESCFEGISAQLS